MAKIKKDGDKQTPGEIIKNLQSGPFVTLKKISPAGALQVRKTKTGGVSFFWRFTIGTSSERIHIGTYDHTPGHINKHEPTDRGYSVAAAIKAAQAFAIMHVNNKGMGGFPAIRAEEELQRQKENAAKAAEKIAEEFKVAEAKALQEDAEKYNLRALLQAYADFLKAQGRRSYVDARCIFNLHVYDAWPEVSALPARNVSTEQIADMMRRLSEDGKGRTANKLRSYIRAAYQTAKAARSKPTIPLHFKNYKVTFNPAAETSPDETANKADKNPLSSEDLRTYWQSIKYLSGFKGAVLRLHLLTGGQRIEQFVNLQTLNTSADAITIYDGKGRPGKPPRAHYLPLIPPAAEALSECSPAGKYALSSDSGEKKGASHIAATTLSKWASEAGKAISGFEAKRIRSGVETLLASKGVSKDIRGRLQSHGIAGVQATHYDAHDYLPEKREALNILFKHLESVAQKNVIPFPIASDS